MNARRTIVLGVITLVGVLVWTVVVFAKMRTVPSDEFRNALLTQKNTIVEAMETRAPERLSLLYRIRFPRQTLKGGTGFIDRTDVYTLNRSGENFHCLAHVRDGRVCYVTFEGERPGMLRSSLHDLFPGLAVE